jgi:hypothetical protein
MDARMGVTLDQILMLTGRLDDASGFDSARERFRRFLLDHIREPAMARVLIDECQHVPTDQHRRALDDLVVLLGRFLGFHARFAPAAAGLFAARVAFGEWRAPGLHVVVDVRSAADEGTDLTECSRAVARATATAPDGTRVVGVCVVTPMFVDRHALEAAPVQPDGPVSVVSLSALLTVTAFAIAGRATHDDVVRLLASKAPLGFVMELLERCADDRALLTAGGAGARVVSTGFWMLRVAGDRGTSAEEFVEIVVGRRHVLGLSGDRPAHDAVQAGDRVCLCIAGKGVVGHGRVAALDGHHPGIRDAHRFRHLWRIEEPRLYVTTPTEIDVETELRLRAAGEPGRDGQILVSISREQFDALTAPPSEPAGRATLDGVPRLAG